MNWGFVVGVAKLIRLWHDKRAWEAIFGGLFFKSKIIYCFNKYDLELSFIGVFWIPAFSGMTWKHD